MGIDMERITFSWVSAAEGAKWADIVNKSVEKVRQLGPYKSYQGISEKSFKEGEVYNG